MPTDRPIIFAVTHIGKFDIERVFEACKTSCWFFNSDPETVYYNFDGFSLSFSGVIHIDVNSKTDRHIALETAIQKRKLHFVLGYDILRKGLCIIGLKK